MQNDDRVINQLTDGEVVETYSKIIFGRNKRIKVGSVTKKSKGYLLFAVPNSTKKVLGHHLVWRMQDLKRRVMRDFHLSHVCGYGYCGRAEHIHQESIPYNESRKGCHAGYWPIKRCPHRPRCKLHFKRKQAITWKQYKEKMMAKKKY